MIGAQAFPNLFPVGERAGIVAAGFMADEVLDFVFSHVFDRVCGAVFFMLLAPISV